MGLCRRVLRIEACYRVSRENRPLLAGRHMSCCHRGGTKESKVRHKKVRPIPQSIWAFVAFLATSVRGGFSPL